MTDEPRPSHFPRTAAAELVPGAPTAAAASARLRQMEADPKWRDGLLAGVPQVRQEFETLTQQIAAAGDQSPYVSIETVDAVTDPSALSRAAYAGLFDGLREQGLPAHSEQYMRDIDSGRRTDRPTAGDGVACRQALDRLTADADWRQRWSNGGIEERNLFNTLYRVISYSADDGKPITPEVQTALAGHGLR
jgi:hypothetical protein